MNPAEFLEQVLNFKKDNFGNKVWKKDSYVCLGKNQKIIDNTYIKTYTKNNFRMKKPLTIGNNSDKNKRGFALC